MHRDYHLSSPVQMYGPAVVTQSFPELQDLVDWRGGEGAHRREPVQKALIIRDDCIDLGLLQHDFG